MYEKGSQSERLARHHYQNYHHQSERAQLNMYYTSSQGSAVLPWEHNRNLGGSHRLILGI